MGKSARKKAAAAAAADPTKAVAGRKETKAAKRAKRHLQQQLRSTQTAAERRSTKIRARNHPYGAAWAEPAPAHLVAKLDKPMVKSKYQSYYEFAENPEKKDKKLEIKVTKDPNPPAGYAFVPVGDPLMTTTCKDMSREEGAMVFIVSQSSSEEARDRISEHVHRTGFHFRETIVDRARAIIGDAYISQPQIRGLIEPIPELQEDINRQADGAIRDLFPRIPNTDREQVIQHAFQRGGSFHGEPTVGLQPEIPLSRRVQLAVLAHIRHTHTRYDKLLRETSWINARKVVEPVCLDFIIKWRGDEETGRDQMDEILREIVILTDSDDDEDDSAEEESSDEDEDTSASSDEIEIIPSAKGPLRPAPSLLPMSQHRAASPTPNITRSLLSPEVNPLPALRKRAQRGFKRYEAAWHEALSRRGDPVMQSPILVSPQFHGPRVEGPRPYAVPISTSALYRQNPQDRPQHHAQPQERQVINEEFPRTYSRPLTHKNEVTSIPHHDRRPVSIVRASSATPLQDMLVMTIEPSDDAVSPRSGERFDAREGLDRKPYARRLVDYRDQSPAQRQVIIIDDDSPLPNRRRLVEDKTSGSFRPLPSRDHPLHITPAHFDSHLASASSAHVHHPRTQSRAHQGLYKDLPDTYTDPTTKEILPVYDAPPVGDFSPRPRFSRRAGARHESRFSGSVQDPVHMVPAYSQRGSEAPYSTDRFDAPRGDNQGIAKDDYSQASHDHAGQYRSLPEYAPPSKALHSYGMGQASGSMLPRDNYNEPYQGHHPSLSNGNNFSNHDQQPLHPFNGNVPYQGQQIRSNDGNSGGFAGFQQPSPAYQHRPNHPAGQFPPPPPPSSYANQPVYQENQPLNGFSHSQQYPSHYGNSNGYSAPLNQGPPQHWQGP